MNHAKIAALYNAVSYPSLLALSASGDLADVFPGNILDYRVGLFLAKPEIAGTAGRTYAARIKNMDRTADHGCNALGQPLCQELEAPLSERVHTWAMRQLPSSADHFAAQAADQQVWSAMLMQYPDREIGGEKSVMCLAYGAKPDVDVLMRGIHAYAAKVAKRTGKVLAQLAAYHQGQLAVAADREREDLQRGLWFGAEKALTTAPRVNERGVPFLGDAALTREQRSELRYWAVPQDAGMSASFPTGTGIALREVPSSKQLIDGAAYLYQVTWGKPGEAHHDTTLLLARLNKARKCYGMLPLFCDDSPKSPLLAHACWKNDPANNYEVKLMQVVYYTTRAEALESVQMVAETQAVQPALRSGKKRAQMKAAA